MSDVRITDVQLCERIIQHCQALNIQLWVETGKLRYRAPHGALRGDLLVQLKAAKEKLIQYLMIQNEMYCDDENSIPLTPIQKAYYIGRNSDYELGSVSAHYYLELMCTDINLERFQKAVNIIIQKFDALRNVILPNGRQKFKDKVSEYIIRTSDFHSEDQRTQLRKELSHYIFPYGIWPMFDIQVSSLKGEDFRLHISFDCLILDAWSAKMMVTNLFQVYQCSEIEWPNYTFQEYCLAEKIYRQEHAEQYKEADEYWEKRVLTLPEAPQLKVYTDFSQIRINRFERLSSYLSEDETKCLYEKSRKYRLTPAAVICTAYMKTLSGYSRSHDLTINITLYNRLPLNEDVQRILGDFTNNGLVTYESYGKKFLQEVQSTQKQMWDLVKYRNYPGVDILKKLAKKQPGKAIMPVVFTGVLQGQTANLDYLPQDMCELYAISQTPQVALDYQVTDFTGNISINWDYVAEAFINQDLKPVYQSHIELLKTIIKAETWDTEINISN